MTSTFTSRLAILVAACACAAALPLVLPKFVLFQASIMLAFAIAILGLNLLLGYSGQVSLAQGAFFALGAYAFAILVARHGVPVWVALVLSPTLTSIAGVAVGLPALRLPGLQLAIVTFGLSALVPQIIIKFDAFTGGEAGIRLQTLSVPGWYPAGMEAWNYSCCLLGFLLCASVMVRMVHGDSGRSLRAIRDNPLVAEAMGVHSVRVRLAAFAVSAAFAGVGGSLFAMVNAIVNPSSFEAGRSIEFVVAAVIGGLTSIAGAVVGAIFIVFLPDRAGRIDVSLAALLYGVCVIAAILFARHGVVGLLASGTQRIRRRMGKVRAPEPSGPTVAVADGG
jgi:branched-chain amino acid transport system permease protein